MKTNRNRTSVRVPFFEPLEVRQMMSSGALDSTFGTAGKVTEALNVNAVPESDPVVEAVQSDGKTVTAFSDNGNSIAIQRFLTSGQPDKTFGTSGGGIIVNNLGLALSSLQVGAVAVQPDGKILVAGDIEVQGADDESALVARFQSNGSLDKSFNNVGYTIFHQFQNPFIEAMAIQHDGKIVIGGDYEPGLSVNVFADAYDLLVARINVNGTLDTTFGSGGKTVIDIGDSDENVTALSIDYNGSATTNPDFGKIVAVGYSRQGPFFSSSSRIAIVRLDSDGAMDNSFAGDGKTELKVPGHNFSTATGVVIQAGGKVVLGGYAGGYDGDSDDNFVLARYLSNGTLDKSFGAAGTGVVDQDLGDTRDEANSLIIGSSQYLIEGGSSNGQFAMAAFTPNGILDSNFGTNGIVKTPFSGQTAAIDSLALGPNQTIVAAGGGTLRLDLARYSDAEPTISIFSTSAAAQEKNEVPATFEVYRDAALPFATRVYFNVSGSAELNQDYTGITLKQLVNSTNPSGSETTTSPLKTTNPTTTGSGLTVTGFQVEGASSNVVTAAFKIPLPIAEIGYVDIPAGQQTADVTITPIDHGASANKTATFSLQTSAVYNINSNLSSTSITIDGDGTQPVQTTNLTATADAYVRDGSDATDNFGTATTLEVKSGSSGFNRYTYVKFDLSSVSTINSVKLDLFGGLSDTQDASLVTDVYAVSNTSWSETGITFDNAPAAGTTALASATIAGTTQKLYTFDVTAYVKAQMAAGHNIVSFAIKNPSTSNSFDIFNSREAASNKPTLAIT